jgi:hypothetical protein
MDMSPYTGSNYIKAVDLEPGVRYEATILSASLHDFEQPDGSIQRRPVLQLDYQGKKLVLNPTRTKILVKAWGPNGNTWIGKMIIFFRGVTNFGSDKVPCVEVEPIVTDKLPPAPSKKPIEPPPPVADEYDDDPNTIPDDPDFDDDIPI